MAKISWKSGRFSAGSTNIAVQDASVVPRCNLLDATSTEGGGTEEWVAGVTGADFSCQAVYDPAVKTFALMVPGTSYTVEFFPVGATTGSKVTGTAFVETHEYTGQARGLLTYRVTGKYTGGVTVSNM